MPWITENDSTGREFQICLQDAGMSCAAASTAMAFFYLRGRRAPEMLARWAIEVGSNIHAQGGAFDFRDWDWRGTTEAEVQDALRQLGIDSTEHTPGRYLMTNRCSLHSPALCRTTIHYGGHDYGHCVVCLGAVPGGAAPDHILILDPERHLQEVAMGNFPQYLPTGPYAQGTGEFTGPCWLCRH